METVLKTHHNKKITRTHAIYTLIFLTCLIWTNLYFTTVRIGKEYFAVPKTYQSILIQPAQAEKIEEKEPTEMKEWVLWKVKKSGLNVKDVKCLIDHESGWREMAYYINTGGKSLDRGLWMWNDHWNMRITNECAFDFKCATESAIAKIKHDGNMNAWWGYVNNCKN